MYGEKSIFASKTFWGAVAVIVGTALNTLGISIGDDEMDLIVDLALQLGGALFAIYGRIVAKDEVTVL